jgi:hypothetical protein
VVSTQSTTRYQSTIFFFFFFFVKRAFFSYAQKNFLRYAHVRIVDVIIEPVETHL